MEKQIRITCDPDGLLPRFELSEFVALQGALKMMTKENFQKLRGRIVSKGVRHPPHVWMHEGKPHLIDGHGRTAVLRQLVEAEGFSCPPIPVVQVEAASIEDAREEVLAAGSNYNTMTDDGLYEFMNTAGIDLLGLDQFVLSEIDMPKFSMDFFSDVAPAPYAADGTTRADFDAYQNAAIKQIVLYFSSEDYVKVISSLERLSEKWGMEDHSQVVWRLLSESVSS